MSGEEERTPFLGRREVFQPYFIYFSSSYNFFFRSSFKEVRRRKFKMVSFKNAFSNAAVMQKHVRTPEKKKLVFRLDVFLMTFGCISQGTRQLFELIYLILTRCSRQVSIFESTNTRGPGN